MSSLTENTIANVEHSMLTTYVQRKVRTQVSAKAAAKEKEIYMIYGDTWRHN